MTSEKLIERLCLAFGPSGMERDVRELIKKEIYSVCQHPFTDRMGNLLVKMKFGDPDACHRKRIMISAHMDEVGFMINEIRSDGTLGFDTVGGISGSVLSGRRVTVMGKNGPLSGIIASKAIHHKKKDERKKIPTPEKLYIDIGASDGDEAEKHVRIGDFAVFDSEFYTFGENMIKSKALDDRMGCSAMIEIMRNLQNAPPEINGDVFFCFTVREEIGLSGAKAATYRIKPHAAIILETTAVGDVADALPSQRVADVGCGVVISVMDRSTIYNRTLVDMSLSLAKEKNISAQVKRYVSGGNDAGIIHRTGEGVKTLALSVPTRYLHSPSCVANMMDYNYLKALCEEMIRSKRLWEEI